MAVMRYTTARAEGVGGTGNSAEEQRRRQQAAWAAKYGVNVTPQSQYKEIDPRTWAQTQQQQQKQQQQNYGSQYSQAWASQVGQGGAQQPYNYQGKPAVIKAPVAPVAPVNGQQYGQSYGQGFVNQFSGQNINGQLWPGQYQGNVPGYVPTYQQSQPMWTNEREQPISTQELMRQQQVKQTEAYNKKQNLQSAYDKWIGRNREQRTSLSGAPRVTSPGYLGTGGGYYYFLPGGGYMPQPPVAATTPANNGGGSGGGGGYVNYGGYNYGGGGGGSAYLPEWYLQMTNWRI